jgi:hypothetical protein
MTTANITLSPHDERRVAVEAGCDPRSVRAYIEGRSQRSTTAARIEAALARLGLCPPPRRAPRGAVARGTA